VEKNSNDLGSSRLGTSMTFWSGEKTLGQNVNNMYPTAAEALFIKRESSSDRPGPPQSMAFITTASLNTIRINSVSNRTQVLFELSGIFKKILLTTMRGITFRIP
jgi:hypothetical protein